MDMTDTIIPRSDQLERWRPVVGYEGGYEVSDLGRVRSLDRVTDRGRNWRGRIMTPTAMPSGYLTVTLWRDGVQRSALVHRLVLTAFVGPSDSEVRHLHGDPSDNRLSELAWGTHSENQFDQVAHGRHGNASKTHCPVGHVYDDENTYVYPGRAHRGCRACRREYMRDYKQRKAVAA